jgi:hypothetical protein
MARKNRLQLLAFAAPLFLCAGCESAAQRNTEEVQTLGRRLGELRREIDNDLQVLAACSAQHPDREIALSAATGILAIVGPPDADELVFATSLTSEGVQEVVSHGIGLTKKRQQILDRYLSARARLTADYHRISGRASAFSLVKFLALGGGLLLVAFLARKIF